MRAGKRGIELDPNDWYDIGLRMNLMYLNLWKRMKIRLESMQKNTV